MYRLAATIVIVLALAGVAWMVTMQFLSPVHVLSQVDAHSRGADGRGFTAEWPMYRGGPPLLGVAEGQLANELSLRWTFETGGSVRSSAAIRDGIVYIGSDDGKVYAIDMRTGNDVWSYSTTDSVESTPCLIDDRLVVGSADGFLYCLDRRTGELRWKYEADDRILGSPNWTQSPGGEEAWIVFGSYDAKLYCVDADDGELNWVYETDNYINGTPSISDGRVVVGGCDAYLHVVSATDGTAISRIDAGAYIAASAALAGRYAYVGHYDNEFICVDIPNATIAWTYHDRNFPYFSSPAVGDSQVIFGGRDRRLHCVERESGEPLWVFRTRGRVDSSPVICGDRVIAASEDGRLYILDRNNGQEVWSYEIGSKIVGSPATAEGIIVIGAEDANVYAFGPSTGKDGADHENSRA